jgi:hypothetical protein
MVVEAIQYNAATPRTLRLYAFVVLHAFVVMPNHVHLLATPALALPKLTKSLKGITSKLANALLAMTGSCFWQQESYHHLVRNEQAWCGRQMSIDGRAWDGSPEGSPADQDAPPSPGCEYMVRSLLSRTPT